MHAKIQSRLASLGMTLPTPPAPVAAYDPYVRLGDLIHVSGQLPFSAGSLPVGKLGDDFLVEDGAAAARICALNLLAHACAACEDEPNGSLRVVKLTGFVNSTPCFVDHPKVINGASEFFIELFGDDGRHARSAVGVSSLPLGSPVEVEGLFSVR